jgi:hypothetical protein
LIEQLREQERARQADQERPEGAELDQPGFASRQEQKAPPKRG